ncbi:MAG: hypothetical protein LBM41_03825 [Ruminococcus sp.]|jgi:hypothetical protein|nr:hypothetical protein [Ruminococcus sp.]
MKKESLKDATEVRLADYLKLKDLRLVEQRYLDIPPGVGEIKIIFELAKKSTIEFGFDIPIQYGYVRITDFAKETLGFLPNEISLHDWQDGSYLFVTKNKLDEKMFFVRYDDVKYYIQNARKNQLAD